jgi:hypothetical protein
MFTEVLKWNESQHPRVPAGSGRGGEFSSSGESGSTEGLGSLGRSTLSPDQQAAQTRLERQAAKRIYKVKTAEEGVIRILKGENVELQDTKSVHTVLKQLGEMAIRAKKLGRDAPNFDPCNITVKGASLFCTQKIRTEEFPNGIPRIEMPQFKSKTPVPGSPADKLPRDTNGEVDATKAFLDHLAVSGISSNPNGKMLARKLKASQAEMEGVKVAGMMLAKNRDPKKAKITVTRDGYVLDGHHTWAAAVGRDAEDGNLDNDMEMDVVIVDLPMSVVYHESVAWTRQYGLPSQGVKKWDHATVLKFFR